LAKADKDEADVGATDDASAVTETESSTVNAKAGKEPATTAATESAVATTAAAEETTTMAKAAKETTTVAATDETTVASLSGDDDGAVTSTISTEVVETESSADDDDDMAESMSMSMSNLMTLLKENLTMFKRVTLPSILPDTFLLDLLPLPTCGCRQSKRSF
jgi:hypothetical protein